MPDEWMERGQVPGQALTAFSEGACPVHRDQVLEPGTVRVLGRDHPAGWCEACRCWWHVGPDGFMPAGCLVATWYTGGRRSGPAAANLGAGGL